MRTINITKLNNMLSVYENTEKPTILQIANSGLASMLKDKADDSIDYHGNLAVAYTDFWIEFNAALQDYHELPENRNGDYDKFSGTYQFHVELWREYLRQEHMVTANTAHFVNQYSWFDLVANMIYHVFGEWKENGIITIH